MKHFAAVLLTVPILMTMMIQPAGAVSSLERIYSATPDEIIIYNADMAQISKHIAVSGNDSFKISLPSALLPDTLRVKVGGVELQGFELDVVPMQGQSYSYSSNFYGFNPYSGSGTPSVQNYILEWDNSGLAGRVIDISYLAHGISWDAKYNCDILDGDTVHLNYAASINNRLLDLEDCRIRLLSGIVAGINQSDWNNMTATQRGGLLYQQYAGPGYGGYSSGQPSQIKLNVHEIYDIDIRAIAPGKLVNVTLFDGSLGYTKHLVWDARSDQNKAGKVQVIYKVENESGLPFAAGFAHMYEDKIFIGMDPMEMVPASSIGNITMGESMEFRVMRYQKDEYVQERLEGLPSWVSDKHTVTLEAKYFGDEEITLEILDTMRWSGYRPIIMEKDGKLIEESNPDNLMKFEIKFREAGTKTVQYIYYTD